LRKNSALFFGRTDLFQFIAEEAGRLAQQSVLILVGQRRTGKTSALLRLDHYLSSNLLPVYVDCQSLGIIPGMAAFFHDIAWLVVDTLETRGISLDVPEIETIAAKPAHWFQREFIPQALALLPDEMTLVLAFDEFEALENLVNDGILPQTFFTYLRHMMQHGKGLSFIFAGTHRLEEMTSDYWSVLFNIALYKEVGYLSREAANQLIAEPVAPHIIYDDLALDKLWRMSAGHPYFLQLVCYTLVKRANQERTGYVTISDVNAAIDEMIQLGEVHFAYLWQQSTKNERLVLTAMAHLIENDTPVRSAEIVQVLTPYGIMLEPTQVTTALNRLVRRSILRTITDGPTLMYEARIGLIFSWVEQTKGLNQLYESWHQLY
jgi:predicted transcriptional regulator